MTLLEALKIIKWFSTSHPTIDDYNTSYTICQIEEAAKLLNNPSGIDKAKEKE